MNDSMVYAHVQLLLGAFAALGLGAADAWHFQKFGIGLDVGLILGGLVALGVNVAGAAVRTTAASLRRP